MPPAITAYTALRKYRLLTEWIWKTFWPTCEKCGKEIAFDPLVVTQPTLPYVGEDSRLEHAECRDPDAKPIRGGRLPVRLMAYRVMLIRLFQKYNVRCWHCEDKILSMELAPETGINLTLHHIDEDRSFPHLEGVKVLGPEVGSNPHAELDIIHETCHKRHHCSPGGRTYKASLDRMNGVRVSRERWWRYLK